MAMNLPLPPPPPRREKRGPALLEVMRKKTVAELKDRTRTPQWELWARAGVVSCSIAAICWGVAQFFESPAPKRSVTSSAIQCALRADQSAKEFQETYGSAYSHAVPYSSTMAELVFSNDVRGEWRVKQMCP